MLVSKRNIKNKTEVLRGEEARTKKTMDTKSNGHKKQWAQKKAMEDCETFFHCFFTFQYYREEANLCFARIISPHIKST